MRTRLAFGILIVVAAPGALWAQKDQQREEDFVKAKPAVGDKLPDVTVYNTDGKEVKTSSLRGHYTVLTFGCLT